MPICAFEQALKGQLFCIWHSPPRLSRLLRDLAPTLRGQLGGSRFAAFLGEQSGGAFFVVRRSVFNLSRSNIHHELPELNRVARAFEPLRTHAGNMACLLPLANPPSKATVNCYRQIDPLPNFGEIR
jgi:hypothetical protein